MKRLFFILILLIIFVGCSSNKKATKQNKTLQEQSSKTQKQEEKTKVLPYKTCSFKAKTSFKGIPISLTIRTTYDSIFWISASSFSMEAIRIKCLKDSVFMINKLDKTYAQWTYDRLQMYSGLPIDFEFLQNMFTDTTAIRSFSTTKFQATMVKENCIIGQVCLPKKININGKFLGNKQEINITIKDYSINKTIAYPFDIPKNYKKMK